MVLLRPGDPREGIPLYIRSLTLDTSFDTMTRHMLTKTNRENEHCSKLILYGPGHCNAFL